MVSKKQVEKLEKEMNSFVEKHMQLAKKMLLAEKRLKLEVNKLGTYLFTFVDDDDSRVDFREEYWTGKFAISLPLEWHHRVEIKYDEEVMKKIVRMNFWDYIVIFFSKDEEPKADVLDAYGIASYVDWGYEVRKERAGVIYIFKRD